jgi:hypothetical protein
MVFPIAGGTQDTSYEIENSLRFNDDDNPNLSRTPSSASNRKTWTWSGWVKRGNISIDIMLLSAGSTGQGVYLTSGNKFNITKDGVGNYGSDALLRDVSAWYHLVVAVDTTQTGMANIAKFYINGTEQSTSGTTLYSTNEDTNINNNVAHYISRWSGSSANNWHDGYLADINFIDGLRLDASYFGETNDNGVWIPKKYTGSYGTNGFFLEFQQTGTSQNSSGIGADTSGNDNHFAVTNLAAVDVTTDTPTNNFCTLNSIAPDTTGSQNHNFFEGNTLVRSSSANWFNAFGTIGIPTSGKWYYEYKTTGSGTIDQNIGFVKGNFHRGSDGGIDQVDCYSLYAASNGNGLLYTDSASSVNKGTGYHWTHDDIMMVAIDTSSRKIWYGKNGTFLGSGDPASGSNEVQTVSAEDLAYGLLPAFSGYHTQSYHYVNFGNPSFSISSGNADANGYGNFEYAPPSGYYSLCTKNLAEFG